MPNVTVIGTQWGDEGKGKIVDWLSERADVIVRFQGGHNAGHTLVVQDQVYKLSLLPSGIVRPGKLSIIGNGVVIDPWELLREIEKLRSYGIQITPNNLLISEQCVLILPCHRELDAVRESNLGSYKIGTTKRGIGPAYEDQVGRRAVRLCDLHNEEALQGRIRRLQAHHDPLRVGLSMPKIDWQALIEQLKEVVAKVLPFSGSSHQIYQKISSSEGGVLFEAAQGTMLDVNHGTYPYVTSSSTVSPQAALGSGVSALQIGCVLGITKAYTTRVGSGPFPTELYDETAVKIANLGREVGTVTGRRRRCGWFDAVLVRQAVRLSGVSGIVLTKIDVLDSFPLLKICTGYRLNGEILYNLPACSYAQQQIEPIYEDMEGWMSSTCGARSYADLPALAIKYVRRIEELLHCPVTMLSTSPERDDTILLKDPFMMHSA